MNDEARGDPVALELLLADAMREEAVDTEGQRRAVAAFRAARDAGRHRARTRDRDDWREARGNGNGAGDERPAGHGAPGRGGDPGRGTDPGPDGTPAPAPSSRERPRP
ncbi:hypothetical protein ABZ439_31235 [Streptomyces sp. NPDC005840]|uniref:Uncharacterized protein n=1 Tax=Streptomyces doudnae TaxID=3075536 RepID=A0ABD5EI56_9ACTN|nr:MULTISPECIES: hypothetical protein [unclassified Streptomyces]MDT0434290.1 hypothetical protein [Streptomyces sp. DSM 41981]MYQ64786.1 hypothetical protein [Streptomyces sp. SID4950]SCD86202.1 hypothetical protein GA0115242_11594 [Streptomyces sp. SolWspMP-5a-2]